MARWTGGVFDPTVGSTLPKGIDLLQHRISLATAGHCELGMTQR
jgi:hypothetical protein